MTTAWFQTLGSGLQNATDLGAFYAQQQAASWTNWTVTTNAATSINLDHTQQMQAAESDEVAWLKRRVREIEWRP